jgi:8-amino-7-oxononanoate synthase
MVAAERMRAALLEREQIKSLRELRVRDSSCVDFSSNDYLGIARNQSFRAQVRRAFQTCEDFTGATGSRLLSGNSPQAENLERIAASFHDADSALVFNSGYDANLSLFSCLPRAGDVIVYDESVHASVHDGMRLGRARSALIPFSHNSVDAMRAALMAACDRINDEQGPVLKDAPASRGPSPSKRPGVIYVAVESIYSMDGDVAPLRDMLRVLKCLSTRFVDILLIVDEAHAVGVAGPLGEGEVFQIGEQRHPNLLARVITYGKALGAHGAMVLGPPLLREYLVNYARPLIYSTALPPHDIKILRLAYDFLRTPEAQLARARLVQNRELFRAVAGARLPRGTLLASGARSPIQSVLVPGNANCVGVCNSLRLGNFDVYPIRAPTVPKGTERIRIIIHAHNSSEEIRRLVDALESTMTKNVGKQMARL